MSSESRLTSALKNIMSSGTLDVDTLNNLTDDEKNIVQKLYDENLIEVSLGYIETLDLDNDWEALKKEMVHSEKKIFPMWKSVLKYVAIFIGLFSIAYFIQVEQKPSIDLRLSEDSIKLKLGDDRIKVIDQKTNQQILTSSGKVIGEQVGNKIRYISNSDIDELIFNELYIPNGKMFEVELSDGTLVYINSGSKIRYPAKFLKGQKREVYVDGEAYFKVTKDAKHPFVVHMDAVEVEVLGTEFNISSYKEDLEIKTVLVEGSVNLRNSYTAEDNIILKPGDKGSWHKTEHEIRTEEVDVDVYTGWMKGELNFRNATFENMTKKLERKYNVHIKNSNPVLANKILTAKFSSEIESIEDVLKSIGEIYPFQYKITDNQILIF